MTRLSLIQLVESHGHATYVDANGVMWCQTWAGGHGVFIEYWTAVPSVFSHVREWLGY